RPSARIELEVTDVSRWKLAVMTFALCCFTVANAKPRIRLGGVIAGASYAHTSGYYPYFGYPYYFDPVFFGSFVHPGFYSGFAYGPNMGEVRLRTAAQTGSVYLDGAYAGELSKLKHMWLEPGAYNLEIRSDHDPQFARR